MKYFLIGVALLISGCATTQKSGLQMYADYKDCEAEGRPSAECEQMRSAAMAQVARDAGDGYEIDRPTTLVIVH